MTQTQQEIQQAVPIIIGFDFQFFIFILKLLEIKTGESVGFELKDDVHIDYNNGKRLLIQCKHTIEKNKNGDPINLRELEPDFWKTINNWIKIINDTFDSRNLLADQIKFIDTTDFIITTNMSNNYTNTFLQKHKDYIDDKINIDDFIQYLNEIETDNSDIKISIVELLKKDKNWLIKFLKNLKLNLNKNEIIEDIKNKIRENHVLERRIDFIFDSIFSLIKQEFFKNQKHIAYTFKEFNNLVKPIFNKANDVNLIPIRENNIKLPENLEDQIFIKQLIDIGILSLNQKQDIIDFTKYKLWIINSLNSWLHDSEITSVDIEDFESNAKSRWKTKYNYEYRGLAKENLKYSENQLIEKANKILKELKEIELRIKQQSLDIISSNGEFYHLSDIPQIGWKYNWEEEYGKK